MSATIEREQDLDAALDDILGEALMDAENPLGLTPGTHMENSRPMPPTLVETEVRAAHIKVYQEIVELIVSVPPGVEGDAVVWRYVVRTTMKDMPAMS